MRKKWRSGWADSGGGLTCLKSQPALVTGALRFRFMECERFPKAMALRDVRVAWGDRKTHLTFFLPSSPAQSAVGATLAGSCSSLHAWGVLTLRGPGVTPGSVPNSRAHLSNSLTLFLISKTGLKIIV